MGPKTMLLLIANLLLLEQRWILLIAGLIILLIAITLVVFFRRRLKSVEKEPEEDWQSGMRSIFAAPSQAVHPAAEPLPVEEIRMDEAEAEISTEAETGIGADIGTRALASEPEAPGVIADEPERQTIPLVEPEPEQVRAADEAPPVGQTRLLHSESRADYKADESTRQLEAEAARIDSTVETGPFDEEVWAQLGDTTEGAGGQAAGQVEGAAPVIEQPVEPPLAPSEISEPSRIERVEQRAVREPFEPPRIKRMAQREPFEPPRIEPLTPREQSDFVRERAAIEPPAEGRVTQELRSVPPIPPAPPESPRPRALRSDDIDYISAQREGQPAPPVVAASVDVARARRAPAGSVLGLPAESSDKPLVLGEPVRPGEDAGIGALSRYGKKTDERSGHTGTVILLAVVLLVGGIVAAYFLVPQFHEWVNSKYAGLRGNRAQESAGPKARIIGYPVSIVNKAGKASGAVENISTDTLEGLAIEVSLQRFDKTPVETRIIQIVPGTLAPNEQGRFEFDFPATDPTINRYVITKLMSNEKQILFSANN
jgi:hypothetical protein